LSFFTGQSAFWRGLGGKIVVRVRGMDPMLIDDFCVNPHMIGTNPTPRVNLILWPVISTWRPADYVELTTLVD